MSTDLKHKSKARLIEDALAEGFSLVGITTPDGIPDAPKKLSAFLEHARHGTMSWMSERSDWRANPHILWPDTKSIIMLAMNYGPQHNPLDDLSKSDKGLLSVYAANRDYHDLIKGKLKQIAGRFAAANKANVKVFVDTAPVMEKPLAAKAGLGWQGKHTNLVSRSFGSWTFLGSIFTDFSLPPDESEDDHCGNCRSCLDICPTNAFPAPYQLDARLCISYLTIEHKGAIDRALRPLMGNRIYGCDDCLAVCPWNKFAKTASEIKLQPREKFQTPALQMLAALDDSEFRTFFSGSPVKRIGRAKFISNVMIAIGNSDDPNLVDCLMPRLRDESSLVRAMAVWALRQLIDSHPFENLKKEYAPQEDDPMVLEEWILT
ncbi:MAG: tRNA epoxyqueuosine(34) reductase QueG [Hyphomicrobiales bacterium]